MNLRDEMRAMGERAVDASRALIGLTARRKNVILQAIAEALERRRSAILEANTADMEAGRAAGLSAALLDRLTLTPGRFADMIRGIATVAGLRDPVGTRISRWIRPNGLEIIKQRVPIGVIVVIYESRPNVTVDSAVLCLKTSNAVILRGGKEALRTNAALTAALVEGGTAKGLPPHAVQLVSTPDREAVRELVQMVGLVDLVIPRGGEALIQTVTEHARVPVIKHYKGVCHTYVDESADIEMALRIVENAKCQRPATCNATEHLLIHASLAPVFLPCVVQRLRECGVRLKGDEQARAIVPDLEPATEADWGEEYLDLILSIRIVPSVEEAIQHIHRYGSKHSDAIVTRSETAAAKFCRDVDSAVVYVNASTRFTDGGEFGMGAEIGISTDKIHARGPMGLEELTTYKYIVRGSGQIRT